MLTLSVRWNEWIQFPMRYQDLPLNSRIAFTIWESGGPQGKVAVGGSTLSLFSHKCTLRRGKQKLLVHRGREADGSERTTTPSKPLKRTKMDELEKVTFSHPSTAIILLLFPDILALDHQAI